ncbi:MAG: hypothetical protein VKK62_05870 [Synechococcaceae cyanobacterium]|nr:hypothetical protein [Synechococcaceae cyanobacterium]
MEFGKVAFYGRLGEQALRMFRLEEDGDRWRGRRVLDCPGGPGSLSALLRARGLDVTAVDPLYRLHGEPLRRRALEDLELAIRIQADSDDLRPDFDLEVCRQEHIQALDLFLSDRAAHPDRYLGAALPELPFADACFDLVLCGHLLFSYAPCADGGLMSGDGLDLNWHREALRELCRVSASVVRLYPGHTISRHASRHPYALALLQELPEGWRGRFVPCSYDQGFEGCADGLELVRDG